MSAQLFARVLAGLRRSAASTTARTPETHDWSRRSLVFMPHDEGQTATAHYWEDDRHLPRVGDYLILGNGDRTSRYQITAEIPVMGDCDMHTYDLRFAPREA